MKRFLGLMLVFLFIVTACGNNASQDSNAANSGSEGDTIKIAFIGNTTGDYQQYGIPVYNASKLYFDQLNEKGGINGKKVEYLEYDDKGDGAQAVTLYEKAKSDGATVVLGSVMTAPTIALADATLDDNFPQVTASATAPGVTIVDPDAETLETRPNVFRSCFTDPYQGEKMAHYAVEKLGAKTAAVFFETGNDYSEGLKDAFLKTAKELGLEVVANEAYATGDKDFNAQMTNIASANPDVVFLPIYYSEAGLAIKTGREKGYTGQFMGGDGFGSVSGYANAEDLEGTVYCSGYAKGTDSVKQFEADYEKAYGEPVPNMFAPLAYDAAMLVEHGVKAAEEQGLKPQSDAYYQAVIDAIASAKELKGITGTYRFDEQHNPIKEAAIMELKGGEEVFKEMY